MDGTELNKVLGLRAKHCLYRRTGDWYHQLVRFPAVLFDEKGYLWFSSRNKYTSCRGLVRKKDLHVKLGISSLRGYSEYTIEQKQKIDLYLKRNKTQNNNYESINTSKPLGSNWFVFKPSKPHLSSSVYRRIFKDRSAKEIKQLHRKIAKELYLTLIKNFDKENISCDCFTGNGTYIDMVRKVDNQFVFYEIKTYLDLRKSVREAFGQLMEYAYWECRSYVKEIIIIGDILIDESLLNYLVFIRNKFNIPLFYQQFNLTYKTLSDKY